MSRKKPVIWNYQAPGWVSPEEEALILGELKKLQARGRGSWQRAHRLSPLGIETARAQRILEALVEKGLVDRRTRPEGGLQGVTWIVYEYRISPSGSA